jgi:hypothetical protein
MIGPKPPPVAKWLQSHTNTRVGGFVLTNIPVGPDSKPVNHYKVTSTGQ